MADSGALFPRDFSAGYPLIVRGEGVYLYDETGKRYLDAGSAAVTSIGHGVPEVLACVPDAYRIPYAHSSQFHTPAAVELAEFLSGKYPIPGQDVRVHFTAGGSESTETALKIVRQYWLSRGEPSRFRVVSRWLSYHGATLGALAVSGNKRRREPYLPILPEMGHINACFCFHCPVGLEYPGCGLACAAELEAKILAVGPETVGSFILEPIVGATTGAVPPDDYLPKIQEICRRYDILLIADEVLTGAGRTGRYFAVEHWGVSPDLILLGKGLSSGYSPLGAVLVTGKVWKAIASGTGALQHGFTYQDHGPSVALGMAVQRFIESQGLVQRAAEMGMYFAARLNSLRALDCVGDVRGLGLLQTVEFVADPKQRFVEVLYRELLDRGVLVYPMRGTIDGTQGEHIMLAPPFTITESQIDHLVDQIKDATMKTADNQSTSRESIGPNS